MQQNWENVKMKSWQGKQKHNVQKKATNCIIVLVEMLIEREREQNRCRRGGGLGGGAHIAETEKVREKTQIFKTNDKKCP